MTISPLTHTNVDEILEEKLVTPCSLTGSKVILTATWFGATRTEIAKIVKTKPLLGKICSSLSLVEKNEIRETIIVQFDVTPQSVFSKLEQ